MTFELFGVDRDGEPAHAKVKARSGLEACEKSGMVIVHFVFQPIPWWKRWLRWLWSKLA